MIYADSQSIARIKCSIQSLGTIIILSGFAATAEASSLKGLSAISLASLWDSVLRQIQGALLL